jgi:suppressor for copper-sensitivity B
LTHVFLDRYNKPLATSLPGKDSTMRLSHLGTILLRNIAWPALAAALALVALPLTASAQVPGGFQPFNLGGGAPDPTGPVVKAKGVIVPAAAGKPAQLVVTADIDAGWHIYSITQPPGGPIRSAIKVTPSPDYKIGDFKPSIEPHAEPSTAFTNVIEETHDGSISWTAPLDLSPGVDPAKLKIEGALHAQACSNSCLPPQDYKFTAQIAGAAPTNPATSTIPATTSTSTSTSTLPSSGPPLPTSNAGGPPLPAGLDKFTQAAGAPPMPVTTTPATTAPAPALGSQDLQLAYRASLSHVVWSGTVEGSSESRGKPTISFRAVSDPKYHIYATQDVIPAEGNRPTIILFNNTSDLKLSKPTADVQPITGHTPGALPYFEQPVTWKSEIEVPEFKSGVYRITGTIGYQTCLEASCDPPKAVNFEAEFTIESDDNVIGGPVRFVSAAAYKQVAEKFTAANSPMAEASASGDPLANIQVRKDDKPSSLAYMLMLAFFAGFILNFMPCVLPVIGLKVLSFVEQAGHDRKKILQLNVWYALGMLTVFWVLAALASGWGQHFSSATFTITVTAIVFVMALSFLGVWEIPIPGFAGSGNAQKLASKEGVSGAYFKGIITTVLATPCSGPGLAAAVGFALGESRPVAFAIFTAMGLGMASPYLLIGFQPSLLRFLPKPGDWMDTFKQIMGFVLLGTVVWLMNPLPLARLLPTITFLFGLWAACWWIGRVPVYAEFGQKSKAWVGALAWGALIGWFSFAQLQPIFDYRVERFIDAEISKRNPYGPKTNEPPKAVASADALKWEHLSLPQLQTAFASNQTVLIDFTADWCATCKLLKSLYLDRPETKKLVDDLGVVTFEADMTNPPQELTDLLRKLNPSGGVPVIAIFPAGDPSRPLVFTDGYTQSQIFDALRKAGPSKPKTAAAPTPKVEHQAPTPTKQAEVKETPADVLDWKFMTMSRLRAELNDRKTVLVNFTADWCPTCKPYREAFLNEADTKRIVEELDVVSFEADMSHPPEEIWELLQKLNKTKSLPTWVVFSASDPANPIVIDDDHSKEAIHKALRDAGKSLTKTNDGAVGQR